MSHQNIVESNLRESRDMWKRIAFRQMVTIVVLGIALILRCLV
jgi:hypothetical protein